MKGLLASTRTLEKLNLSQTIYVTEVGRQVFDALYTSSTLKFVNLAGNRLRNVEKEFGARIGRLIQVSATLNHLDVRYC